MWGADPQAGTQLCAERGKESSRDVPEEDNCLVSAHLGSPGYFVAEFSHIQLRGK